MPKDARGDGRIYPGWGGGTQASEGAVSPLGQSWPGARPAQPTPALTCDRVYGVLLDAALKVGHDDLHTLGHVDAVGVDVAVDDWGAAHVQGLQCWEAVGVWGGQ